MVAQQALIFLILTYKRKRGFMDAEHSENIVYGRNAVLELLQQKPESIEKIYFQFNTSHPKLKEIVITARRLKLVSGKARLA